MISSLIRAFNSALVTAIGWTQRTSPSAENIFEVMYGNGIFVGVSKIPVRSVDGINWTLGTNPAGSGNSFRAIAYGNGLFVMGVYGGTSSYRIFTSPDGITWTGRSVSSVSGEYVYGIAYGNGRFVVSIGNGSDSLRISTSLDGITWTDRTPPAFTIQFNNSKVSFYNGYFLILNGSNHWYARSVDGIAWTIFDALTATSAQIIYGNNLYVVAGYNGTSGVATSADGVTWTNHTTAFTNAGLTSADYIYTSIFVNGLFLVASSNGKLLTSTNGITWTQRTSSFGTFGISGVTYGNGLFVITGMSGKIATSSS